MEAAIQTVVKVYLKSTKGKDTLGGKDFQGLVKSQLSNILTDTDSKAAIAEMRQGLDDNQDGKVSFEEYMKLVGYLATSLSQQRGLNKEDPAQSGEATAGNECAAPAQQDGKKTEEAAAAAAVTPAEKAKEEVKPAAVAAAVAAPAAPVVEVKKEEAAEAVEKAAEAEAKPAAPTAEEEVVVEAKSEEAS